MDYRAARKCNEVNLLTAEESVGGSEQINHLWKRTLDQWSLTQPLIYVWSCYSVK